MASSNSKEIDRWRKNLEESEAELESKTAQLEDAQLFFCGVITKLARLTDSNVFQLDTEIIAIKRAANDANNLPVLKKAVESLTNKIMRSEDAVSNESEDSYSPGKELVSLLDRVSKIEPELSRVLEIKQRALKVSTVSELTEIVDDVALLWKESTTPEKRVAGEDPSNFCALLISEILYQLLEKVSFPNDLSNRLDTLKRRLEEGVTMEKWSTMLDQISDIASETQIKINRERLDIENFLKQVTGRLKDLDSYIQGSEAKNAEAWMHGSALGDAVKNEMQSLVSNANGAIDLSELKEQIQSRLAKIENHVNGFREKETSRSRNADDDVQRLMARLNELESESQNLKARVQKERMQAQVDTLTGISNRLGYDQRIAQEYARWKRFNNPLTLLVWDVDFFKRVNDDYGHAAGDKALKSIAKILADKVRETDYLARYGGEEFVLIMPGANLESAWAVADKLRESVADSGFHFKGKPVSITISAGVAEFQTGDTTSSVFERADKALYSAKEAGRNRVMLAGHKK